MHNSCKKAAQLAKVIAAMDAQKFDLYSSRSDLFFKQDFVVDQVSQNYIETLTSIYEELVRFRKDIINDACTKYGQQYKQTKQDFTTPMKESLDVLNLVRTTAKSLKQEVHDLKESIKNSSENISKLSDSFLMNVGAQNKEYLQAVAKSARENMNSYKEKEKLILSQHKNFVENCSKENGTIINGLKNEIRLLFAKEVNKRIDKFRNIRNQISSLKNTNFSLKNQYSQVVNQKKKLFQDSVQKRQTLVSQTNKEYKPLTKKIVETRKAIKQEKQSFDDQFSKETKAICSQKQRHNKELAQIQLDLNQIYQKEKTASNAFESKKEEQNLLQEKKRLSLIDKYYVEEKAAKDHNAETNKLTKESLHKLRLIYRKINARNAELVQIVQAQKENLLDNIHDQEETFSKRYKSEETGLSKVFQTKQEQFLCFIQTEKSSAEQTYKKYEKQNQLLHDANLDKENRLKNEREEKTKKNEEQMSEGQKKFNEILSKKKNQLEDKVKSKIKEAENNYKSVMKTFDTDLKAKKEKIIEDNSNITLPKDKENIIDIETKKHKAFLKKQESELNILNNQCIFARKEAKKKVDLLNDHLLSLDKQKRQQQRAAHQSELDIVNEFETQIQVLQVQLNDKINNISLLYNDEENKRGQDLIDFQRKVLQYQNRTKDMIMKEERKLEELKQNYVNEYDKIKIEMENIRNGNYEAGLKEKLNEKEKERKQQIENYEKETEAILQKIKNEIEETKQKINNEKDIIKDKLNKIKQENKEENLEEIKKQYEEEQSTKKQSENGQKTKEKIIEIFEEKKEKLIKSYANDKNYIEQQKKEKIKNIEENEIDNKRVIEKLEKQYEKEFNERWIPFEEKIKSLKEEIRLEQNHYDLKIKQAENSQIELIINAFNPEKRKEEETKFKEVGVIANIKLEEIREQYDLLIDIIRGERPRKVVLEPKKVVEPPAETRQNSSRRVKRKMSYDQSY